MFVGLFLAASSATCREYAMERKHLMVYYDAFKLGVVAWYAEAHGKQTAGHNFSVNNNCIR